MKGVVYLIGAGPGDPGLLTLRGAELLGRAEVVLYDGLSNADILAHAPTAEQICVGKHGQHRIWTQAEIIDEMLRFAEQGKIVARLKGGDPAVFARSAEEVNALQAAGIPFEIVPGITAALAASSYAGIPITCRGVASAVALVTGHEEPGKSESSLDWIALAKFPGTLVIYMGVTTAPVWTKQLIDGGKSPATPVAILRRCSMPDQRTIRCRLDQVTEYLTPASKLRPPVIVIVGDVTDPQFAMSWFEQRPLFGRRVLVCRPEGQQHEVADQLTELGATVLHQPAITVGPPDDPGPLDHLIHQLSQYDVLIFTSQNAVTRFFERLQQLGFDSRALGKTKIAVVGERTAQAVRSFHLRPDFVPETFNAVSLAQMLKPIARGKRFAWPRASRGNDELTAPLVAAGGQVDTVVAYRHADVTEPNETIHQSLDQRKVDWVLVTSPAIARSLYQMFHESLQYAKLASLSPTITATLAELGLSATVTAKQQTLSSLVESIIQSEQDT